MSCPPRCEGTLLRGALTVLAAAALCGASVWSVANELLVVRVPHKAQPTTSLRSLERFVEGCRIVRLDPASGREELLTPEFHSAMDPALSTDGSSLLFAGQRQSGETWQIWQRSLAGGEARQITHCEGHCVSPLWVGSLFHLDDERPTARFVYVAVIEDQSSARTALFAADLDGGRPWRLSFNLGSDYDPEVLANGRLVYTSSRRLGAGQSTSALLELSIDGTGLMPYFGNHQPPAWREMARAGADERLYFIRSETSSWLEGGALEYVLQRRPLHSHGVLAGNDSGRYLSPCPLGDKGLLVSWRPPDSMRPYALWRLDPVTGERLELVDGPQGWHSLDAQELKPRATVQGRSSVVNMSQDTGVFYCLSAHRSDRSEVVRLEAGQLQVLRVLEGLAGADGERVLGELPLDADGSFHIEVPASAPLRFQILDDAGVVVAEQESWTWVMPREWRGCIGCHENRELAPPNVLAEAVVRPAVRLERPADGEETALEETP